jgi:hypothetical protein
VKVPKRSAGCVGIQSESLFDFLFEIHFLLFAILSSLKLEVLRG